MPLCRYRRLPDTGLHGPCIGHHRFEDRAPARTCRCRSAPAERPRRNAPAGRRPARGCQLAERPSPDRLYDDRLALEVDRVGGSSPPLTRVKSWGFLVGLAGGCGGASAGSAFVVGAAVAQVAGSRGRRGLRRGAAVGAALRRGCWRATGGERGGGCYTASETHELTTTAIALGNWWRNNVLAEGPALREAV